MRAIALSLIGLVLAGSLAAEQKPVKPELADRIGDLAGALAGGNALLFLRQVDRQMPGYEDLRQNVRELISVGEVESSVKPLWQEEDGSRVTIRAEWSMLIRIGPPRPTGDLSQRRAVQNGEMVERKEMVTLVLEKRGRKWRFVDLKPLTLFAAPLAK